ncbi:MAG: peptide chain release factor-like protein [Desulfarculaceae bacterium]|nr:peptide chain release factor-like protein [Desulfarculaceae bacterium]
MDLPPNIEDKDLVWEFFRGTGPGGQHRNKTETGVRLTHLPSGIVVTATERRSQYQNREVALLRLADALAEKSKPPPKPRRATKPTRAAKRRRLEAKKQRGQTKALRRKPVGD